LCTVTGERAVLVCDIAIDRVRRELAATLGPGTRFTHVDFEPTLVEAAPEVDGRHFIEVVLAASAAAQRSAGAS
jgi:hypothetical protein